MKKVDSFSPELSNAMKNISESLYLTVLNHVDEHTPRRTGDQCRDRKSRIIKRLNAGLNTVFQGIQQPGFFRFGITLQAEGPSTLKHIRPVFAGHLSNVGDRNSFSFSLLTMDMVDKTDDGLSFCPPGGPVMSPAFYAIPDFRVELMSHRLFSFVNAILEAEGRKVLLPDNISEKGDAARLAAYFFTVSGSSNELLWMEKSSDSRKKTYLGVLCPLGTLRVSIPETINHEWLLTIREPDSFRGKLKDFFGVGVPAGPINYSDPSVAKLFARRSLALTHSSQGWGKD